MVRLPFRNLKQHQNQSSPYTIPIVPKPDDQDSCRGQPCPIGDVESPAGTGYGSSCWKLPPQSSAKWPFRSSQSWAAFTLRAPRETDKNRTIPAFCSTFLCRGKHFSSTVPRILVCLLCARFVPRATGKTEMRTLGRTKPCTACLIWRKACCQALVRRHATIEASQRLWRVWSSLPIEAASCEIASGQ